MASEIITRKEARAQGLKRYFTGAPCKRGHIAERHVSNLTCIECGKEKQRAAQWHVKNRERHNENGRKWRAANLEKVNVRAREASKTPEAKARRAVWYANNRDRINEKLRAECPERRAAKIASAKAWAKANPERFAEHMRRHARKRRAQKHGSNGTHTAADLAEILKVQGNRCAYCRADLRHQQKHVDHIKPLALGGSNARANLQYLCRPCNQSKSARDPIDYARSLGRLL